MKPALVVLPFLAILFAALAVAAKSALVGFSWVWMALAGFAAASLLGWIALDLENFKRIFNRKGAKYGAASGLTVLTGLLLIIGLGVLTSKPRFNKSFDVTREGLNTLSDQSVKMIENLREKKLTPEIVGFFENDQQKTKFIELLRLYEARGLSASVSYIDPQTDPTKAMAEGISGTTVIVRSGKQQSRLTTYTEEKLTNALMSLLKDGVKKIYFTKGHGEGDLASTEGEGLSTTVGALKSNNYETAALSLLETAKVPDDAQLLVLGGLRYDLKAEEVQAIEAYLKSGRALLVLADAMSSLPVLNSLLEKFGLKFNDDLLILSPNDPRAALIGQNNAIISEFDSFSPITKDFASKASVMMLMPNSRSIEEVASNPNQMKVTMVAKTAKDAIIKIKDVRGKGDLANIGRDRIVDKMAFPVIAVASGQLASSEAGAGTNDKPKAKELRIVAAGSALFAANVGAQRPENLDLFTNIVNYLLQDEDFIAIRPKDQTKTTLTLTSPSAQFSLLLLSFVYPFFFLGLGTMLWFKRRRA